MNTMEPKVTPADETNNERRLWIGPDDRGVALEIIAIVETDYLLVIHVMPYRYRYRRSTP